MGTLMYSNVFYCVWQINKYINKQMILITSSIVINVPTRGLLAVETMYAIVQ